MIIVATTSLPAVDRSNADRWNATRSCQYSCSPIPYLIFIVKKYHLICNLLQISLSYHSKHIGNKEFSWIFEKISIMFQECFDGVLSLHGMALSAATQSEGGLVYTGIYRLQSKAKPSQCEIFRPKTCNFLLPDCCSYSTKNQLW